jgi:hypothetical protein
MPSTRLEPHWRMDTKATGEESVDSLVGAGGLLRSCQYTESERGILYHSMDTEFSSCDDKLTMDATSP